MIDDLQQQITSLQVAYDATTSDVVRKTLKQELDSLRSKLAELQQAGGNVSITKGEIHLRDQSHNTGIFVGAQSGGASKMQGGATSSPPPASPDASLLPTIPPVSRGSGPLDRYENGMDILLARLGSNHPRYDEALVYEERLRTNIMKTQRYGDTTDRKADRSEIVEWLNKVAQDELGISFNDLSVFNRALGTVLPSVTPAPAQKTTAHTLSELRTSRHKRLSDHIQRLNEDLDALYKQRDNVLDDSHKTRISRNIEELEQQLTQAEQELKSLEG